MMTKFVTKSAMLAVAAMAGVMGVTSASAQSGPILSTQVKHDDLNLATQKGQDTLKVRFRKAVEQVCPSNMIVDSETRAIHRQCRQVASKSADTQMAALLSGQQLAMR